MNGLENSGRFMRPMEVGATHRSRRRVQFRRILFLVLNLTLFTALASGSVWLFRKTQEDKRFAIRKIEILGLDHASREDVDAVLARYDGANLFQLDIELLETELSNVPWIERVAIEKQLPGLLRLQFIERVPAALVRMNDRIRFIDAAGVVFADFEPGIGREDFPVILDASSEAATRCVAFLESLREQSPDLYVRIDQIEPEPSIGWKVHDRLLDADVFLDERSVEKWRTLSGIAEAEGLIETGIEYADLRFERQIVVKKRHEKITGDEENAEN